MFCVANKLRNAVLCSLAVLLCIGMLAPVGAYAKTSKSLMLICRRDDTILKGMRWKLYKVGERSADGESFVLTGDFANYQIDLSDFSEEVVTSAATTLESYAIADQLTPLEDGRTDDNGELVFDDLDNGLYLAIGKILLVDITYYVPSALLIEINEDDETFSYDAYPKYYYGSLSSEDQLYTVRKVWVDDDDAYEARPVNVTVDLYCNGVLDDTVILSEENNWQYRWYELDGTLEWHVVEREIPVGYEVLIDRNETQFLIKNSYKPLESTPTTASTSNHSTPTSTVTVTSPTTTITDTKLPQTGQLWWPVIPLSCGGLILLYTGLRIRSKEKDR